MKTRSTVQIPRQPIDRKMVKGMRGRTLHVRAFHGIENIDAVFLLQISVRIQNPHSMRLSTLHSLPSQTGNKSWRLRSCWQPHMTSSPIGRQPPREFGRAFRFRVGKRGWGEKSDWSDSGEGMRGREGKELSGLPNLQRKRGDGGEEESLEKSTSHLFSTFISPRDCSNETHMGAFRAVQF